MSDGYIELSSTSSGNYGARGLIIPNDYTYTNFYRLSNTLQDNLAFLKVKDSNGKYVVEGAENWFGVTLFNYEISDLKMEKILDIMDYLLSEEGTRLAVYGKEGTDYNIVNGEVAISDSASSSWVSTDGVYNKFDNGAKNLRYIATLGEDIKSYDPMMSKAEKAAYDIVHSWEQDMLEAKRNGQLRIVKEPSDIAWLSAPIKNSKYLSLFNDTEILAVKYYRGYFVNIDKYKNSINDNSYYNYILDEINAKLGK